MSDTDKMEEAQKRINALLENFKASKVFPKSMIMKYYNGLEITYDEFIDKLEKTIVSDLNEKESSKLSKILEDF